MSSAVAIVLLAAVLIFATVRPRRLPEAVAAIPAAAVLVLTGIVSWPEARQTLGRLGPTVGFLAAVLMLAHAADRAGVFSWAGSVAAVSANGNADRLLRVVFVIASITTAVLSLDATVVLLTPVVLVTAKNMRVPARPHAYACAHLANSASLLLPVANLTNLLAFAASGLTFFGFAGRMALPWLAVIAVEYLIFRRFFRADLADRTPTRPIPSESTPNESTPNEPTPNEPTPNEPTPNEPTPIRRAPIAALVILGTTLAGFGVLEPLGVHPAWVALAGTIVLGTINLVRRRAADGVARPLANQLLAANPAFCAFVFALGIVVFAVGSTGFGHLVERITPTNPTLPGLLAAASLAAVLANVLNNLPATLLLVPLVAHSPVLVLAVLLGVNIGPNLTYVGSLATLLWREVLHARDHTPDTRTFLRLGALTVPTGLLAAVLALWVGNRIAGR